MSPDRHPDPLIDSLEQLAAHATAEPRQTADRARAAARALGDLDRPWGAFTCVVDPDTAAARAEAGARTGGPLAGIAVGVKDIFDTRDLHTAYGSVVYPPERARHDAAIVARLHRCGAWVIGKTTTTEFAYLHPTATRNPRAPGRTPGGSSAGSAAAVAAGLVPLAVGTQTGGSVIRPASYCGVVGYKPSFGWLPTPGLKCFSWSLDTVGLFTRTVRDMAWAAQALTGRAFGAGAHGADSSASDAPRGRDGATLVIGVPLAYPWGEPSGSARHAVEVAAELLVATGVDVRAVALPPIAGPAFDAHAEVQNFEAATALHAEFTEHRNDLSTVLRRELEAAVRVTPAAYELAQHTAIAARRAFEDWRQAQGLDLLLTPSAPDEAPTGLESTGTSTFNRLWTLLGWPCVNVPGRVGTHGAPMGVQLIGPVEDDARVLKAAAWLERAFIVHAAGQG